MLPVEWQPLLGAKLPKEAGVYLIRNTVNEKLYVGKSVDIHRRIQSHLQVHEKLDYLLYRAMRKYGLAAFEVAVYTITVTEVEAFEAEIAAIEALGSFTPKGYNLTKGGDGSTGYTPTEEIRKKMSAAQLGRVHSEETKAKQSESAKLAFENGRLPPKLTDAGREAIRKHTIARNMGAVFTEERKANMSKALKGRKSHGWSEESRAKISKTKLGVVLPHMLAITGEKNPMFGKPSPNRKAVLLWEGKSSEALRFPSVTACARHLNVSSASVSDWLSNRYATRLDIRVAYAK